MMKTKKKTPKRNLKKKKVNKIIFFLKKLNKLSREKGRK